MKIIPIFLCLLFLWSCFRTKEKFSDKNNIDFRGTPQKIEFFISLKNGAFQISDTPIFVISNEEEIKNAINEIKNATNPEPWKGAGWNRIKVYYADTTISLNTNNKRIGTSASGKFYDLKTENFITRKLHN